MTAVLVLVAIAGAAYGGAALATDTFPDVPDDSPFHDEVSEFGDAGCADGFPDGNFRPTEGVKRQQMARFMTRCGGRVVSDDGFSFSSGTSVTVASADLTAPANGFVLVNGTLDALVVSAFIGACPCQMQAQLTDGSTNSRLIVSDIRGPVADGGASQTAIAATEVFPIAQGQTKTFSLMGRFNDSNLTSAGFGGEMTAVFVPFAG